MIYGPVYKLYKNVKLKIHLKGTSRDAYNPIFDAILNYELWQRNYTAILSYSQHAVPLQAPQRKLSTRRQHWQSSSVLHTTVYNPNFYSHIRKSLYRSKYYFY
jgi:hypothetical protein